MPIQRKWKWGSRIENGADVLGRCFREIRIIKDSAGALGNGDPPLVPVGKCGVKAPDYYRGI